MEDQPTDSGDLKADAATASVPQGKLARNRHRLPRQRQQVGSSDDAAVDVPTAGDRKPSDTAVSETVPDPADPVPRAEPVPDAEADVEADELTKPDETGVTAVVLEPTRRVRMPWKRKNTVAGTAAPPQADDAATDPRTTEVAERVESTVDAEPTQELEPAVQAGATPAGDEPEVVLVPHRTAGRAQKLAAAAAGAAFVAAAAFAGTTIQPYLADRAAAHTKFEVAETAANAITTLWTYTPENMETLPDRSAKYLSGDFASDYKRYIDGIAAANKQAQITNNTQVLGAAVETLTPTEATAIVYTNSVATSPVTKGIPSLQYLSYRLDMARQDRRWLITRMTAITKVDLTPRL